MISKTHISAQKPRGRQINAKVCDSKSAIFLLCSDHFVKERYLKNGSSSHRHFITKLILITARSFKPLSVFIERLQGVWPKIIPVTMEMPIFYVNFSSLNYPNLNDESLGPYG